MYWRMGVHSNNSYMFKKIKKIGIYNPRMNTIYQIGTNEISDDVISQVEVDVIGYKNGYNIF
jgi:hypothetical protein